MTTTSGTDTKYILISNEELGGLYQQNRELRLEVERLRAIERQARYYLSSEGDTYQAYLKLCEVCGIPPEEESESNALQ